MPDRRMTDAQLQKRWQAWLSGRPEVVRRLAEKYPPGTAFELHGRFLYVVAYTEDGGLEVSPVNPFEEYEQAVRQREPICACCLGKLEELLRVAAGK